MPERIVSGVAVRHADPRLPRRTPRTRCGCGRPRRPSRSTSRRSTSATTTARSQQKVDLREPHQGALSERRAGGGQGAAARAAVLLRLLLAAGHAAPASAACGRSARALPREVRGAAERHASGDRGRRADAAAGRRARHGLGRGVGHHAAARSPTRTTRCCPRRSRHWPLPLFGALLPRHLEIIYEINRALPRRGPRRASPATTARVARLSLIDERGEQATCAWRTSRRVGSHAINGVAALHSRAAASETCCATSHELWPERFNNVTNGVTPRRFLVLTQSRRSRSCSTRRDRRRLDHATSTRLRGARAARRRRRLPRARGARSSARTRRRWRAAIRERTGIVVDPDSLFDVQVKRIHEYKRQHLNLLHVDHALPSPATRPAARRSRRARSSSAARRRPGYRDGQADHPADQRASPRWSTATRRSRDRLQGRVPARLQRQERAAHLSRPPICPSRSRPPARRRRAPAT